MDETYQYSFVQTDTLVTTGVGKLRSVTFTQADAAPTAGSIVVYDGTSTSGAKILDVTFTTAAFLPATVPLLVAYKTGLYVKFNTTADVNVTVAYK
jgi:hypothetical protein